MIAQGLFLLISYLMFYNKVNNYIYDNFVQYYLPHPIMESSTLNIIFVIYFAFIFYSKMKTFLEIKAAELVYFFRENFKKQKVRDE